MKVILLVDVKNQGKKDDVIEVSNGYAKNYLFKNKLAVAYTKGSSNKLNEEITKRNVEEENLIIECNKIKEKLESIKMVFVVKTGVNDKVFGSVSSKHISEELKTMGYNIDKKNISIKDSLDELGEYLIDIVLHKKVKCKLKVILTK